MTSRLILATFLVASALAVGRAQSPAAQEPAFDVASIKPTPHDVNGGGFRPLPGRFIVQNVPARTLIGFAYRDLVDDVEGAPGWSNDERYDITAKVADITTPPPYPAMLRTLLRERFNFAGHIETRTRDVLALQRVKADAPLPRGMKPIDVDCKQRALSSQPIQPQLSFESGDIPVCYSLDNGAIYKTGGASMEQLASLLRPATERQVIDETGLSGYYAFELHRARRGVTTPPRGEEDYPDISTALREHWA